MPPPSFSSDQQALHERETALNAWVERLHAREKQVQAQENGNKQMVHKISTVFKHLQSTWFLFANFNKRQCIASSSFFGWIITLASLFCLSFL